MEVAHDLRSPRPYHVFSHNNPGLVLPEYWSASLGATPWQVWSQQAILDQQITSEVLGLLNQVPVKASHVIETMLEAFYLWLPIVHTANFIEQVHYLPRKPNAEVATLLLAIHLMNQLYAPSDVTYPEPREDDCFGICRRFFNILQLDRNKRLETIQAGVLLSALELHAGKFNQAALTVTTCVSLAYKLGLDQAHVAAGIGDSELDIIRRNTWCSIIFLDR